MRNKKSLLFLFIPSILYLTMTQSANATDWTVMVYMCADNSLNEQSYQDLSEMMQVSSTTRVKIIIQIDNLSSSVEPNCRRYLIENGNKVLLSDLGLIDMANPQTLIDFARFTSSHYNADKYFLILWDHGNGWPLGVYGGEDNKGIIYDQSSNNWIGVAGGELRYAMTEIKKVLRKNISIVGFDACLMSMVEVGGELTDAADIMFASEEVTPWNGLPYNDIFSIIINQPSLSAIAYAKKLVDVSTNSYNNGSQGYEPCTFSAIDLKKLGIAQNKFISCSNLLSRYANTANVQQIRHTVQTFSIEHNPPTELDDYIDLIDFLIRAKNIISNHNDLQKITEITESLKNSVLAYNHVGSYLNNANGISIWFPDNYLSMKKQSSDYLSLIWQKQSHWLSFLNNFYGIDDIKPSAIELNNSQIGRNNDYYIYWNQSIDLASVRYNLLEVKSYNLIFSDFCDTILNWSNSGFMISSQHCFSYPTALFSGVGNNLNNELTLTEPIQLKCGGLLSFMTYYSTEESYYINNHLKCDIFYIEISNDRNNYQAIDSFYGNAKIWTEHRYILPQSESLWLRFRYKTDATIISNGVFFDDIKIYDFYEPRAIASNQADTSYYIFDISKGTYYYLATPVDSFGNIGFVSSIKEITLSDYAVPYSLPSPFINECKIFCDYPHNERLNLYIYTISGELVRKFNYSDFRSNMIYWDGKNQSGREVTADIYIIILKSNNFTRIGKIAKVK